MKIEIWSDFTCPWCYIGKLNLEEALKDKNIQVEYIYNRVLMEKNGLSLIDQKQTIDAGFQFCQKPGKY